MPAGAPPGYQSPYYAPVPGQGVAVHRTSPGLIIGIVGGLVLLMVAAMFLIGLIFLRPAPTTLTAHTSPSTPAPSTPVPSTPTPQPSSSIGNNPTPTPAPTQRPTPTAAPTPTPGGGGGGTIKTTSFQVKAPGWKILKQDSLSVTLLSPQQDGTLAILSGTLKQPTDTQTFVSSWLSAVAQKYPDAKVCLKQTPQAQGGKDGILVVACYTNTPSSGSAFVAADLLWAAVDQNNTLYLFEIFCDIKNFDNVIKEADPVVADGSLVWAG
jgi:hypothetical protein